MNLCLANKTPENVGARFYRRHGFRDMGPIALRIFEALLPTTLRPPLLAFPPACPARGPLACVFQLASLSSTRVLDTRFCVHPFFL